MIIEMGTRFYHRTETDRNNDPRYCIVIQVAKGRAYWRFYGRGTRAKGSFEISKASEHVLRIVD